MRDLIALFLCALVFDVALAVISWQTFALLLTIGCVFAVGIAGWIERQ